MALGSSKVADSSSISIEWLVRGPDTQNAGPADMFNFSGEEMAISGDGGDRVVRGPNAGEALRGVEKPARSADNLSPIARLLKP